VTGNPTVTVNGRPIAREFDFLDHGAVIQKIAGVGRDVVVGVPATTPEGEAVDIPPECAFLRRENIDDADTMTPLPHDRLAKYGKPFSLGSPTRGTNTNRNEKKTVDGDVSVVTIDGKQIRIVREDGAAPNGTILPTDAEVAASLATLPKDYLDGVDTVVITPTQLKNEQGEATTVPADYGAKEVYLYPRSPTVAGRPRTQGDLNWQMVHEVAHGYDEGKLIDDAAWNAAVAADRKFPSDYARRTYADGGGTAEDYAESVVMYALVRGT